MSCQPTFDELISCSLAALEWNDQNQEPIQSYLNERFRGERRQKLLTIDDFLADYRPDKLSVLSFMSHPDTTNNASDQSNPNEIRRISMRPQGSLSLQPYSSDESRSSSQVSAGLLRPAIPDNANGSSLQRPIPASQNSASKRLGDATSKSDDPKPVRESKQDRRRRQNRESQRRQREKRMRLDVLRSYAESHPFNALHANSWPGPA